VQDAKHAAGGDDLVLCSAGTPTSAEQSLFALPSAGLFLFLLRHIPPIVCTANREDGMVTMMKAVLDNVLLFLHIYKRKI